MPPSRARLGRDDLAALVDAHASGGGVDTEAWAARYERPVRVAFVRTLLREHDWTRGVEVEELRKELYKAFQRNNKTLNEDIRLAVRLEGLRIVPWSRSQPNRQKVTRPHVPHDVDDEDAGEDPGHPDYKPTQTLRAHLMRAGMSGLSEAEVLELTGKDGIGPGDALRFLRRGERRGEWGLKPRVPGFASGRWCYGYKSEAYHRYQDEKGLPFRPRGRTPGGQETTLESFAPRDPEPPGGQI